MDASEFKKMFLPLNKRMYWAAWQLTGNAQEAEDLVQEAYLKLWTKRDQLHDIENTGAYCITLLRRIYFDEKRRKRPEVDGSPPDAYEVADGDDTGHSIELRDESSQVMQLIDALPDRQRQIIILRDVDDLPYDEIETRTGMNAVNVRVLLSRARKMIRKQFKEILDYERK
jgi:RNA polymerase sigma-70 factor (ECF subfamily)